LSHPGFLGFTLDDVRARVDRFASEKRVLDFGVDDFGCFEVAFEDVAGRLRER